MNRRILMIFLQLLFDNSFISSKVFNNNDPAFKILKLTVKISIEIIYYNTTDSFVAYYPNAEGS